MRVRFVDEGPWGLGWIAPEPATVQRASHALGGERGVWLVDPVDGEGVRERVAALGPVSGVLQLLGRHARDGGALAAHFGVPLHVLPSAPPLGAPFELVPLTWRPWWRELALWWPARRLLLVPEALGTAGYFRAPGRPLGVHPMLRATPPRRLAHVAPDHLLVGHGEGLHRDAAGALGAALAGARRETPRWLLGLARSRGD